jgi:hypothetical protein
VKEVEDLCLKQSLGLEREDEGRKEGRKKKNGRQKIV